MDVSGLNGLSRRLAARLIAAYPGWERGGAEIRNEDGRGTGWFEVKVSDETGRHELGVTTRDNEITVWYGEWHTHFGTFLGLTEEEVVDEAMNCLDLIVSEEYFAVITHRNGKWHGASLQPVGAPADEPAEGDEVHAYSWRGTYDRTL